MSKKVLIIDDEAGLRRNLSISLLQEDYDIEACENGTEALNKLKMFKENNILLDFIVTDVRLPDIDGMKLLKIIKSEYSEIPVIIITAFGNASIVQEIDSGSADGYLEKPFSAKELTQIFNTIQEKNEKEEQFFNDIKKEKVLSAYLLIKAKEDADLEKIYSQIYSLHNVVYCDGTKTDYDIILLLQSEDVTELKNLIDNKIKKIEGIESIDFMPIKPYPDEGIESYTEDAVSKDDFSSETQLRSHKILSAYVLIKADEERLHKIFPEIYFTEDVAYCDYTKGKYNIVALLQGQTLSEIDEIVDEDIKPIKGVKEVVKCQIIKITDM